MRKYQEPQMNLLELELVDIVTASGGLWEPGTQTGGDGNNNSDSMGWDEF